MIWQGPREGKMKQIPSCDWQPEQAWWAILPARDCPFCSRNKISLESKWTHESFLSQNNFRESKRILCDFSILAFLWTSTSSRSIKTLIETWPTWPRACSIMYRVFQKFVDILKSLYFIHMFYFSLHFLADINRCYCLSIFRTILSRTKTFVEITIFPLKGANLCRVFLYFSAIFVCFQ